MDVMALLRLDKYLADMQVGTRSEVKAYIRKGRIMVDNKTITSPDIKIDTQNSVITFDGNNIAYSEFEYYMLNKPAGVLTATMDKKAKTVLDLIVDKKRKDLFPVGRLDKDTEGLLLITNDGDMCHELLAPKKHVDKVYYAKIWGMVDNDTIDAFNKGIRIDADTITRPALLRILKVYDERPDCLTEYMLDNIDITRINEQNRWCEIEITIHEGKFHQVKRMFEAVDTSVIYLKRLAMGPLKLDKKLAPGEYRHITDAELSALKEATM